jgi:hypothetical protein
MLTRLVPRARSVGSPGETEDNNARQRRNSYCVFENKSIFHDLSPVSPAKSL